MEIKNVIIAVVLSLAILFGYQYFFASHQKPETHHAKTEHVLVPAAGSVRASQIGKSVKTVVTATEAGPEIFKAVPLPVYAPSISGSLNLRGARIDDVSLLDYHTKPDPHSPFVQVLSPEDGHRPYYIQFGWSVPEGSSVRVPGVNALWKADGSKLTPQTPVTLSWNNGQGLIFRIRYSIDQKYMFTADQSVENRTSHSVALYPWAVVHQGYTPSFVHDDLAQEGPIAVANNVLNETSYKDARENSASQNGVAWQSSTTGGWIGLSSKYFLAAVIPDQTLPVHMSFRASPLPPVPGIPKNNSSYVSSYIATAPLIVKPYSTVSLTNRAFVGAESLSVLGYYQNKYGIPRLRKAVDLGRFYFITEPTLIILNWLNSWVGNFGIAIILFTLLTKIVFFPLANKSYRSMNKMRLLAPKMKEIKAAYPGDTMRQQKEISALYKQAGASPVSGCLPMLIQLPFFYALYLVIDITIQARNVHFLWIKNLAAPDPTNIFNLFGLLHFDPSHYIFFLHIGALPLLMGISMYFQMRLSPTPSTDPIQSKMFMLMPVIFTFFMAGFSAGLVLYWTCNNILSIAQQWYCMRGIRIDPKNTPKNDRKGPKPGRKKLIKPAGA